MPSRRLPADKRQTRPPAIGKDKKSKKPVSDAELLRRVSSGAASRSNNRRRRTSMDTDYLESRRGIASSRVTRPR
jgi:hypothetical protein